MKWLSIYLYYSEPFELLLTKGIRPLLEQLSAQGLIRSYFFIRYWENGPHIRLRLQGEETILRDKVFPEFKSSVNDFLHQFPSLRTYENANWKSVNNTLEQVDYLPEIDRYGGEACMPVSERLFEASSRAVLQLLDSHQQWNYERAIGMAIPLHLAFLNELNLQPEKEIEFLSYYVSQWIPSAYNQRNIVPGLSSVADVQSAFQQSLTSQKENLFEFVSATYLDIKNKINFEEEWMNEWIREVRVFHQQLHDTRHHNNSLPLTSKDEEMRKWSIYNSQLHMTNNRLGINNRDESFIAFILREILSEINLKNV